MAVFMEMEMTVTPDQYDAIDAALDPKGDPPDGLIAHTARFDGETLKVLDIWESPEAFGAFAESRLGPGIAETLGDDAPPPPGAEVHRAAQRLHGLTVGQAGTRSEATRSMRAPRSRSRTSIRS